MHNNSSNNNGRLSATSETFLVIALIIVLIGGIYFAAEAFGLQRPTPVFTESGRGADMAQAYSITDVIPSAFFISLFVMGAAYVVVARIQGKVRPEELLRMGYTSVIGAIAALVAIQQLEANTAQATKVVEIAKALQVAEEKRNEDIKSLSDTISALTKTVAALSDVESSLEKIGEQNQTISDNFIKSTNALTEHQKQLVKSQEGISRTLASVQLWLVQNAASADRLSRANVRISQLEAEVIALNCLGELYVANFQDERDRSQALIVSAQSALEKDRKGFFGKTGDFLFGRSYAKTLKDEQNVFDGFYSRKPVENPCAPELSGGA